MLTLRRLRDLPVVLALLLSAKGCTGGGGTSPAAATDPLAGAPADWGAFLSWAATELARVPEPQPLPPPNLSQPRYPAIRLTERYHAPELATPTTRPAPLAEAGPFRSDQPGPDLLVRRASRGAERGVFMNMRGFSVQRQDVGAIEIELRQPVGRTIELKWSEAGAVRAPLPSNERFWTIRLATDGFADWTGLLKQLQLIARGDDQQVVEIRALRFLAKADGFGPAAGVRRVNLDREVRTALFSRVPAELTIGDVTVPRAARLQTGLGILRGAGGGGAAWYDAAAGQVEFEILVQSADQRTSVLRQPIGEGGWQDATIDLSRWSGQTVTLTLTAHGAAGAVALWGAPTIYEPIEQPARAVLYLIDALAAKHVNLYGAAEETMPRLSALSGEGVWFANMFANSPRTVESVPAILLSLPTERHGVYHPSTPAAEELVSLAEVFQAAGFATAFFCTNVNSGAQQRMDQGFDHFFERYTYFFRGEAGGTVPTEDVLKWLDAHRDRPAFVYIHTVEPHAPYEPPAEYRAKFRTGYTGPLDGSIRNLTRELKPEEIAHVVSLYHGDVAHADARLGALVDALRARGEWARTTLAVTSDHGEEFFEHGSWQHSLDLHNELMRVPLVLVGPNVAARGRIDPPVQQYDLMPTLLGLFELPLPYTVNGHDLRPLLTAPPQPAAELSRRSIVAANHNYRADGIIEYALIDPTARWKLMYQHEREHAETTPRGEFALYDLQADFEETRNVLAEHPERARELIGHLLAWRRAQAPLPQAGDGESLHMDPQQLENLRALGYIE